jgi:hypothetical protein
VRAIRNNWPNTRILIRADSHYCSALVIDWCRANDVDFIFGVAPTSTLRRHVTDLEASTMARFEASARTGKVRRFKAFFDGAGSWSRVERIIARVEVGSQAADTRFIVTNLTGGRPRRSTRTSTAGAARPKTTSSPGRRILPPTGRPAPGRQPTSSGSSCMPAPTG